MSYSKVSHLLFYLIFTEAQVTKKEAEFVFDREQVGVEFAPYVKLWVNGTLPAKNSYSVTEVKEMLRIVAKRFTNITTFGMGVKAENVNQGWDNVDADCLVAVAAAELNRENSKLLISVAQGIEGNSEALFRTATEYAISAAKAANDIYPGTVWGLLFGSGDAEISESFLANIGIGKKMGLKIGSRIPYCHLLKTLFEDTQNNSTEDYLRLFDYVVCIETRNSFDRFAGPDESARRVAEYYENVVEEFSHFGLNTEVILGDLRWPSSGQHFLFPEHLSNIQNFYTFWTKVAEWASKRKARVQMHGAIDEPGKSIPSMTNPNAPDGRYGVLGHLGWWRRVDNDNITAYAEKILEPDQELHDTDIQTILTGNDGQSILAFSVVGTGLLIACTVAGYLLHRLKLQRQTYNYLTNTDIRNFYRGSKHQVSQKSCHVVIPGDETSNQLPYNGKYEIRRAKLHIDENCILGEGEYGRILKGQVEINENLILVAIKTTKYANAQHLKNLLSELKLLIYIERHENIVQLVGAYTKEIKHGIIYLAVEYCERGSLESIVRNKLTLVTCQCRDSGLVSEKDKLQITISQLNDWAFQIANGMQYLGVKKVIHSDLATRNILVTNEGTVRITDFGLSRRFSEYAHYIKTSQEPLPWRWMAIESLRALHFSTQSDVWSYGVTLWEIYSLGEVPYPGLSWNPTFVEKLKEGLRMPSPHHASEAIYQVMKSCWEFNPCERPSFTHLTEFFSNQVLLSENLSWPS